MEWNLVADRPIYAQLMEFIQMQIVSGIYAPGDRLPTVREMAAQTAVNPNTMQKAFSELERSGLIVTQRTNGRIVTENRELITELRRKLAGEEITGFYQRMTALGYRGAEIVEAVSDYSAGREKENE